MVYRYSLMAAAFLTIGIVAGWSVNGWRLGAKISAIEKQNAEAVADAHEKSAELSQRIAQLDSEYTKKLKEAKDENQTLMHAVATNSVRLHVRAACGDMSKDSTSGGVGNATQVELSADARPDYHAHIDAIADDERVIAYLQAYADRCSKRE